MKKIVIIVIVCMILEYFVLWGINSNQYISNDIPVVRIELNGVSLDTIHENGKDEKYPNNSIQIYDSYKILDSTITIKGRGNYTWTLEKRPYQIIFDEKISILGLPKSKKYVLLANMTDPSLLKNDFTYSVAKKMGLPYSFTGKFVDLYIDEEYLGNYYVTPKISINKEVVNLKDDHALLLELDNIHYEEEDYFLSNTFHDYIALKDNVSEDYHEEFSEFQKKYNEMETAIVEKDYSHLEEIIDVDSFAKYYLISEFAENSDSLRSSLFFHMDGVSDKIHIGPIWDFDIGYGLKPFYSHYDNMNILNHEFLEDEEGISVLFYHLCQIPEFMKRVYQIWNDEGRDVYQKEIDLLDSKSSYLMKSGIHNNELWEKLDYKKATSTLKYWMEHRYQYFDSYMRSKYEES